MQTVLDAQEAAGETGASLLTARDDTRLEVYQAQGMVMIQLGVGAAEALSRMRAHAYANELRLGQVAADIIGRRLTLEPDKPEP
jgi:AmiR/NasT family two-component response regulator